MKSIQHKNYKDSSFFDQERSHYQQIIDQLTRENQMLKRQLQNFADLKSITADIHRAQTKEDQGSGTDIRRSQPGEKSITQQKTNNCEAKIKQSKQGALRSNQNQLQKMSWKASHYENKMQLQDKYSQQLTYFLNTVKQKQYVDQSQTGRGKKQQLSVVQIVQIMEDVIAMFENDRSVLISKIEELLLLIATYDTKEREFVEKERQFELDLSIANEQLVIFKRLKKTK